MKSPQPIDLNSTLVQLTESLNKMDFTQKPYKPMLYPTGRGRGRGRGGRPQGRKFQARNHPYNPQNRGRGGFRGKPRGGKFDRSPTKRKSPGKTPKQRIQIKIDAGTVERLVIG